MAALVSQETVAWATVLAVIGVPLTAAAVWYQAKQYRRGGFNPKVTATIDESDRIHVRIHNRGAGTGEVNFVRLFGPHVPGEETEVLPYYLEENRERTLRVMAPFPLPGRQTAHVFIIPDDEIDVADIRDGRIQVNVEYGDGTTSDCKRARSTRGHDPGTTHLPAA
jgi:hypothetical protein